MQVRGHAMHAVFKNLDSIWRVVDIKQTKKCWQECGEFGILVSILSYCSNLKQSQNNEYELIYIKCMVSSVYNHKYRIYLAESWTLFLTPEFIFYSELWKLNNLDSWRAILICYAAAKSLESCLTLCNPRDGSPPGSPVPRILKARTLEWGAISFSNAWKWKVKSLSDPMDCSLPDSSVHGIFQARVLEWGATAFSGSYRY